jgi:hypothetical protein
LFLSFVTEKAPLLSANHHIVVKGDVIGHMTWGNCETLINCWASESKLWSNPGPVKGTLSFYFVGSSRGIYMILELHDAYRTQILRVTFAWHIRSLVKPRASLRDLATLSGARSWSVSSADGANPINEMRRCETTGTRLTYTCMRQIHAGCASRPLCIGVESFGIGGHFERQDFLTPLQRFMWFHIEIDRGLINELYTCIVSLRAVTIFSHLNYTCTCTLYASDNYMYIVLLFYM